MGNVGLQDERLMRTKPSNSYADSARSFGLQRDAVLDARSDLGDSCAMQLHEAIRHIALTPAKQSWSPSAGKSAAISLMKILWASPWSLWGLGIGFAGLLTGGGVQRSGRVLEFWGGCLPLFLKYFPFVAGSPTATFGHVILGRSERYLDACRPHQLIHVRQYECWGPLFVPTYLICWFVLWCFGKRPYYDNPFERQAFDETW